jgi:hypothetical protein
MTLTSFQIVFDCAHPESQGAFWALALGYAEEPPPPGFASWEEFLVAREVPREEWDSMYAIVPPDFDVAGGSSESGRPRVLFIKVPEGKAVKNRLHLDLNAGGGRTVPEDQRWSKVLERVAELEAAGATRVGEHADLGSHWIVMTDPEGNEFCVQ